MEVKNKAFFAAVLLLLLVAASGCVQTAGNQGQAEKATVSLKYTDKDGATILEKSFLADKGTNAFEALKANVAVDYDTFAAGAFVKGIAGVAAPEGYYLALYVDGEYAQKGISDYTIEKDTAIEWKTESLESFGMP
jgi:hypothetical protein